MKLFSKEIKIALSAVVAGLIIYFGIIFLKGAKLFDNSTTYIVEMDNVEGLSEASEVLANGLSIGVVRSITYNPEKQNLAVELDITPKFKVPKETTVFITSPMLGSPKINLKLGANENGFMNPGDTMYSSSNKALMDMAAEMLPSVQALIPKIDSILTNINNLTANPALTASLNNLEQITGNLRTTTNELNVLLNKDVKQLVAKADNVMGNAETLTSTLNSVDIVGMANNANILLDNTKSITENLNNALQSKNNTLGLLLNDNSIALQLDSTMTNASLLLEDLRLHPKRYVHFSLFGRKEK